MNRRQLIRAINIAGLLAGVGLIVFGVLNAASSKSSLGGQGDQALFIPFGLGLMLVVYFGFNLRMMSDGDDGDRRM